MRVKLIAILVANLFAGASAWGADEGFIWSGSVGLGARGANVDGESRNGAYGTSSTAVAPFSGPQDEAKASEYRDLRNAVIGVVDVNGSSRDYYARFFGENFGLDDQYLNVRGGGWDVFKAQLYSDRMPHNLSWQALSPLLNPGGTLQTASGTYPPAQNPALWNSFDYGLQRNTAGGNLEVSMKSPFFFRVDYNEVTTTGTRPGSGQLGTGSGNGLIELGIPVDYKTKNTTVEGGYAAKSWNVKLAYLASKFSNDIDTVQWTNFYLLNQLDTSLLPKENELTKWTLSGSVRDLPWDSTIVARFTQSKLTSDFDVAAGGLKPTGTATAPAVTPPGAGILITTPTPSTFNGEHKTTSASVTLSSMPLRELDGKIYYNYYDKENNSTPISYAAGGLGPDAANCPGNTANKYCIGALAGHEPFAYKRQDAGIEANWRIARKQRLTGGYGWLKVDRELELAKETEEDRLWVEYKNTMLANLAGRIKYQYMQRRSDIDHGFTASGSNPTPAQVPYYYSSYDVANFDQNMIKVVGDWAPMNGVTVGFGATYKKTEYKDLQYYGRTDDRSQNYDLTVAFGDPAKGVVTVLGNWGEVTFDQAYHQGTGPAPGGTQTATDFDWGTENSQTNWMIGLVADWPVMERLMLSASLSYQKTGGGVDFWSGNTAGAGGFQGGPLVNYVTDNTKMTRINLKGTYAIDKNWSATAGYAYEKYDYTDDQMRGYQGYYPYYQNLGSSNNSWFSGAFANPSYTLNVFYVIGTYRFN